MEIELKDTVALMNSDDYKKRFKAEYLQLKIRITKLKAMLDKWEKGELPFVPTCPRSLLERQLSAMNNYIGALKHRAKLEDIQL